MNDLISRQAAIDAAWFLRPEDRDAIRDTLKNIPSTQTESIEQIRWERDVAIQQLSKLGYGLGEKRKTGKWISHKLTNGDESIDKDTCSKCGNRFSEIAETGCIWDFCPICGSKMEV